MVDVIWRGVKIATGVVAGAIFLAGTAFGWLAAEASKEGDDSDGEEDDEPCEP